MTRVALMFLSLSLCQAACAQSDDLRYKVGNTVFSEDKQHLVIHTVPPTQVDIQPGGKLWPPVVLDEAGRIYAGQVVIDANSGREIPGKHGASDAVLVRYPYDVQVEVRAGGYEITKNRRRCNFSARNLGLGKEKSALAFLRDGNLRIASSGRNVLALVTQFSGEGTVSAYQVDRIDLASCKVASVNTLGNPDLLVEIAASSHGGWWITGSIEQTLLRSEDGKTWGKVPLPPELSSLISSYVVNPSEIWLAAMLASDTELNPYMLVYSANGGKTWTSLKKDDPLLKKVPSAWLEGQKRIVLQAGQ
jgi:hypothetical protein